ncbi:HECT type ubiquitin ligase [Reticulomyxa filosa]|uniref:HECT type ubiquitin ligase n=1 Tax=Reticulomyxa filosa TaxID=46433 RepID=X6NNA2_RETFI|nr:HECT type ubiquitin ligase [Reticulomyxa filosa]|eukprot:ETO27461.1 HECT type ubiquitin ligase [Reticulomyxa filosa]
MEFFDRELGVFFRGAFPVRALHIPFERYQDPVEELNIRTQEVIDQIQDEGLQPTDIKKEVPIFGIGSHYVEIEHALSIRKVRRSVLWLLRHWPGTMAFDMEMFGGVNTVIRLLDLAAAEALSAGTSKSKLLVKRKNSLIKDFGKVFDLLREEGLKESILKLRLSDDIFQKKRRSDKPTRQELIQQAQPCTTLTQGLIEECILHFVQAVNDPNEVLMFESQHKPYPEDVDERRVVYVPGASRLMVTFDAQCNLANDFKTGLTFYADQDFEDQYLRCRGTGADRFPTFIVPSNRFWFKFTSSFDNQYWGYRFYVKPIEKHIDDFQAIDAFNFELGCWLFELLMEHKNIIEQPKYVTPLADSLLHFVIYLKSNVKTRGIEQLIKLLLCVHKLPTEKRFPLNLSKLEELGQNMDDVVEKMIQRDRTVQSQLLNSIVELMAITELFRTQASLPLTTGPDSHLKEEKEEKERETKTEEPDLTYDHNDLYVWKINIVSAVWGIFAEQKTSDITDKMKAHINNCGGTRLMLPPRSQWVSALPNVFVNDVDTNRPITDKEVRIEYDIRRDVYDHVSNKIRTDVLKIRKIVAKSETPVYICAQQSTFDRVVEMSSLTLTVHQGLMDDPQHSAVDMQTTHTSPDTNESKIPSDGLAKEAIRVQKSSKNVGYLLPTIFLGEVSRAVQLAESYLIVSPHNKTLQLSENEEVVPGKACPTGGIGEISEFTVMFWLYLDKRIEGVEGNRTIFRKGDRNSNSALPWIYLPSGNKSNAIQTIVTTKANNHITLTHEGNELTTGSWHHVAVTANAIGVKLFVDGNLVQKQRTNGALKHNNDPIYLGKCPPGVENGYPQPPVKCLGVNGSVLDTRYYLQCLPDKKVHEYTINCQILTSATGSTVKYLSDWDPQSEAKLSLKYLKRSIACKVSEFDSSLWSVSSNLDNEVMALFENCYQDSAINDLRDVWRIIGNAAPADANGNVVDNAGEREARNAVRQLSQLDMVAHSLYPDNNLLERHDALSDIDIQVLRRRFLMLQILNYKMKAIFPLVDFTQVGLNWSLAARLCSLRSLIFSDLKRLPWQNVLQQTSSTHRTSIKSTGKSRNKCIECYRSSKKSIFGQAYRTLNFVRPVYLRCAPNNRPWGVTYEGEGGTDAGGLFRDSLSALSGDLQSDHLPLFIKCPNSRGYGDNQEKWIPNPSCTSSLYLSMYTFVGKLMGVAIRGKHYLNLDFPCVVWKPLVGKPVGREDLKEIDSLCFDILDKLSNIEREGVTPQTFSDYFPYHFTTTSSDGRQVLLKPDGDKIQVTWENRKEYVQLLEHYRLNEFSTQVDAIRRGLATIVPIALLPLFTWQELELMICGKREIDLELLKANTVYKHGVKATDQHVQFFWQVLEDFTHQQRSNFLRFVWGQSRLPTRSEDFHDPFGVLTSPKNDDFVLPVSRMSSLSLVLFVNW